MITPVSGQRPATLEAWAGALGGAVRSADGTRPILGVADDSRAVEEGFLFVARAGTTTSGLRYVRDALARGAAAVVAEADLGEGVPAVRVGDAAEALRRVADYWYGHPQSALDLVGITGTKGKTTTAWLAAAALRGAGVQTGVLGTIAHDLGDGSRSAAANTTPGLLEIRRLLALARDAGTRAMVMEVSSHALDQGRTAGLDFRVGVFTNLGRDHLDYHADVEAYFQAKARLFRSLRSDATAFLNADDSRWWSLGELCRGRVLTYGTALDADLRACALALQPDATRFCLRTAADGEVDVETPLVGRHNVLNLTAAIGVALALDVDLVSAVRGAESLHAVPGRLERVRSDSDVGVFVDYAHTAEALRAVLEFLNEVQAVPLTCVVGCGGDRDASKRPRMAAIAAELSSRVVLTSDNPRTEDPRAILRDMEAGVPPGLAHRVETVPDRREAIRRAVVEAPPGGSVLVAGKGHEDYQILGTEKLPFDDAAEVRAALRRRDGVAEGIGSRGSTRTG